VVGPGRVELTAAMGTTPVVMGLVLGQDRPQMPLAEDQHPVGDLGPGCEHEPFRIGIRARAPGRDFTSRRVGAPLGRRRDLQRLEDPADRRCANPVADLEQLTLDPLVSPAIVLRGEPLDERGDLGADWRPSRAVRIGPLPGDQAAVPAQKVPGVTSRCARNLPGRSRISAAITARSAQSSRGRGWVRRSTATSYRSTKISAFFDADDRPSRTSQLQSRTKMR
jgi:hypothetical protein